MNRNEILTKIKERNDNDYVNLKNIKIDNNTDLSNLDLHNIDFTNAYGENINFSNSNLEYSNFTGTRLEHSNFENSDLKKAILDSCDLRFSNFKNADCRGTKFRVTIMENSIHDGIIIDDTTENYKMHCPEIGTFVGYKKCFDNRIVTLLIPADARRVCATTRPCRCDKAKVINITDFEGNEHFDIAYSLCSNNDFCYKLGEMVYPDSFNPDRWMESTHGIHFWMTREEAVNY